jgi:hypothetical protein
VWEGLLLISQVEVVCLFLFYSLHILEGEGELVLTWLDIILVILLYFHIIVILYYSEKIKGESKGRTRKKENADTE